MNPDTNDFPTQADAYRFALIWAAQSGVRYRVFKRNTRDLWPWRAQPDRQRRAITIPDY